MHGTAAEVKWQGNSNSLLIANNVLTVLYESQKIHLTSATLMNPVLLLSMSQCSPLHVLVSVTSAVNLCDTYNITYTRGLVVISWHFLWDGRYYVLWGLFFFLFSVSLALFLFLCTFPYIHSNSFSKLPSGICWHLINAMIIIPYIEAMAIILSLNHSKIAERKKQTDIHRRKNRW